MVSQQSASKTSNLEYVGIGKRFFAFLIDLLVLGIIFYFTKKFLPFSTTQGGCQSAFKMGITLNAGEHQSFIGLCGWFDFGIILLYYFLLEWKLKATVGKLMTGLKVVSLKESALDWKQVLVRNLLRVIDFLPFFYILGAILIGTSDKQQRLGDRLANTTIIKK